MKPKTMTRLDWLSVNMVDPYHPDTSWESLAEYHANMIYDLFGWQLDLDVKPGRAHQHTSLAGSGAILFFGGTSGMTFELPGIPCAVLHAAGKMRQTVETALAQGSVTRLDIATDIETDTDPRDFVLARVGARLKSHQTVVSPSGVTCYLGSPKSDRFARVYRYHEPHERAGLLRVEMVFRKQQAHHAAREWLRLGDDEFAAQAGNIYGWTHEDWDPKARRF